MSQRFWLCVAGAALLLLPLLAVPREAPERMSRYDMEWMRIASAKAREIMTGDCILLHNPITARFDTCCFVTTLLAGPPDALRYYVYLRNVLLLLATGAGLAAVFVAVRWAFFMRRLRRWRVEETDPALPAMLAQEQARLGISHPVGLARHKLIRSPMVLGIFRPVILLPYDMHDEVLLPLMLRHELVHVQNKDVLRKRALLVLRCVLWFNPFVYALAAQANKDMELRCDTQTLHGESNDIKTAYAHLLLRHAQGARHGG